MEKRTSVPRRNLFSPAMMESFVLSKANRIRWERKETASPDLDSIVNQYYKLFVNAPLCIRTMECYSTLTGCCASQS